MSDDARLNANGNGVVQFSANPTKTWIAEAIAEKWARETGAKVILNDVRCGKVKDSETGVIAGHMVIKGG